MRTLPLRSFAIIVAAGVGLGGCAYGPYGGTGVSVGYGNGYYDPYYDARYSPYGSRYGSRYGYGYSPYRYSRYGYGYGYAPYGWYDGFYYPGTGYYVYDSYRRPRYWSDAQRRYWNQRLITYRTRNGNRSEIRSNWSDFLRDRRVDNRRFRQDLRQDRRALSSGNITRQQYQAERKEARQQYRKELREDRRALRKNNRRDRRD